MEAQSHRVSKGQQTHTHLTPLAPCEPVRSALVIINSQLFSKTRTRTRTRAHAPDFSDAVNLASGPWEASGELMAAS